MLYKTIYYTLIHKVSQQATFICTSFTVNVSTCTYLHNIVSRPVVSVQQFTHNILVIVTHKYSLHCSLSHADKDKTSNCIQFCGQNANKYKSIFNWHKTVINILHVYSSKNIQNIHRLMILNRNTMHKWHTNRGEQCNKHSQVIFFWFKVTVQDKH